MLPAVVPFKNAYIQMIGHTIALVATTLVLVPVANGDAIIAGGGAGLGPIYVISAAVLGAAFLWACEWLRRDPTEARSMRVFGFSITYVSVLFAALTLDVLV